MQIEDKIFLRKRFDRARLLEYGFMPADSLATDNQVIETILTDADSNKEPTALTYERELMDGDFLAVVTVSDAGKVSGSVIDNASGEEYDPLRNPNYFGAFVGSVRQEYEALLLDIAANCCSSVLFVSDQANRIADLIHDRYAVEADFPWDSESNSDSGVFRHTDTGKWFGLIMNIRKDQLLSTSMRDASGSRAKGKKKSETVTDHSGTAESLQHLNGTAGTQSDHAGKNNSTKDGSENIDVINLKKDPSKASALARMDGVHPAFHMNHKLWISVALDDTLSDDEVMQLIDDSYRLTGKKKSAGISEEIIQRVLIIADCVPPGQVITYGQIAAEAGIPKNARLVGKIMSMADRYGDHPCHRVVAHNGRTVPGWTEQRSLLEAEGVTFMSNGCVNMQCHNIP